MTVRVASSTGGIGFGIHSLAWIIFGTGPFRAVLIAAGGLRAVGGAAGVMAEQATSELAGLLRQLRAEARLTGPDR